MIKRDLQRRVDWSDQAAFQAVDTSRDGAIGFENVLSYCHLNGYQASQREVAAVIRRLDIDADNRITFQEWVETMQPLLSCPQPFHANPRDTIREHHMFANTSPPKISARRHSPSPQRPSSYRSPVRQCSPPRMHPVPVCLSPDRYIPVIHRSPRHHSPVHHPHVSRVPIHHYEIVHNPPVHPEIRCMA
jgi:hypothetical protein